MRGFHYCLLCLLMFNSCWTDQSNRINMIGANERIWTFAGLNPLQQSDNKNVRMIAATREAQYASLALWQSISKFQKTNVLSEGKTSEDIFPYGVASGDPLADGFIIWTMLPPHLPTQDVLVEWSISDTPEFSTTIRSGLAIATEEHHFRIKEDIRGLAPNTTYYYRFNLLEHPVYSAIGRTRTAPAPTDSAELRFAVVSCNAYEWGHFNGFGRIAEREDLSAVLHLGDYIYEYATGEYGDLTIGRTHHPRHELLTEQDYHKRYAQYRSDSLLQAAHQQHPFICIWDDHEVANNNYTGGAENHDAAVEGDYLLRSSAAQQVFYDWMPIREDSSGQLYRSFKWGQLADLHMLDERLAGRTSPASSFDPEDLADSSRRMLGERQFNWLTDQLQAASGRWQLIGNQVLFANLDLSNVLPEYATNIDAWDGFLYEKNRLIDSISLLQDQELLFLTGDTHCSWQLDVRDQAGHLVAHELAVPSISSANFDELGGNKITSWIAKQQLYRDNPHLNYTNLTDHGYLILEINSACARAEYHYSKTIREADRREQAPTIIMLDYDHYTY